MTKKFFVATAVFAIALAMVSGLSSCQDEELGVSETVLKERAFEQGFTKAFGQPSADQSWDFYAQKMESLKGGQVEAGDSEGNESSDLTRATMDDEISFVDAQQPASVEENQDKWTALMPEGQNNSTKGQNYFSLVSTGTFTVSAVQYSGRYESQDGFKIGIRYNDNGTMRHEPLFGPSNVSGNPGFAKTVTLPKGTEFSFYIEYTRYWIFTVDYYTDEYPNVINTFTGAYDGPALLLYSGESETEKIMIVGFEEDWGILLDLTNDYDFNDVVLYISGAFPVASPKRFMCEDLSSLDFDYNDVVFDVSNTGITLRAVGGTLPVYLQVKDKKSKTTTTQELHGLLGGGTFTDPKTGDTYYQPINVGGTNGITKEAVKIINWTDEAGTRLDNDDLEAYNGVTLLVAKKYGATPTALTEVDDFTQVNANNPALLAVPSETKWMKELTRIDKGYPNFYQNNWYETTVSENLYHE